MNIIKVFISSVFDQSFKYGFKDERISLKERINGSGDNCFTDISLDYDEPNSDKGSFAESIEKVNNADIIVLFIGTRYGTIRKEIGKSLTHEEYLQAVTKDKNILIYEFPADTSHIEHEKSKEFLKNIYENDRQIVSSISNRLKEKFLDIIDYKKGKDIELNEESKKSYLMELSSLIYNDLQKAKESLLYLPKGVERFQEDEFKENKLKVEYVKRSVYKELYNLSDDFLSEIDIFNKIFNEDKLGILIYGEGGIGKTRLSKELALMAKNNEWQVLIINSKCDDLDTIKYKTNSNYCLFFDYIETQMFSKEEIEKHIKKHHNKNKIRVILNSRNTYVNIDDYKDDDNFINLNISSMNNEMLNEKNYINFVIEKMFEQKGIDKKNIQLGSLVEKPSFAIFMLETGGKIEDLEKINFRNYLKDFFKKSFEHKDFNKIEPIYFYILANLPLDKEIKKDYKKEIDILRKEKLVEFDKNDEMFKALFNDTIIDELLDIYLNKTEFNYEDDFEDEIKKFFNFSIERSTFKNIINTFGKISAKEIIKNRSHIFKKELKDDKYKDFISENIIVFKKSNILNELDKLIIRMLHDTISITSKDFTFALSRAVTQIIVSNNNFKEFEILFDNWIKNNNENSLKFLYQDISASFIICGIYDYYIKHKEIKNFDINFYSEKYLENFIDSINISFVFEKYLEFNKDISKISEFLIKYINLFSDKENCSYVIQKYLDGNGDIRRVEDSIIKYINLFSDKENCSYVIQKYLDGNGDIRRVEDSIIKYINLFSDKENCSYVIQKYFSRNENNISFNNIRVLYKYLDYLKFKYRNYDKLISYKETLNSLINSYNFNMNNSDIESYILVILRIQEKDKKIFSDDVENKILREIIKYKRGATLTKNYLVILDKYLSIVTESRKSIIFEIINEKIKYSILETPFLDDNDNLVELAHFVDKYSDFFQNNNNIKDEIIKRIYLFFKNKKFLEETKRDLTRSDKKKSTEKIVDFLKYDTTVNEYKNKILIEFINFLPISDIVEDKLTIYFSLFNYLVAKSPELINNNILNIRKKYLEFLELSRTFSNQKKNKGLRVIYSEKLTNEEILNLILEIIKENIQKTFILEMTIKFILAKNDFSLLKEDIKKFVEKNSKEVFDKFYNDDIEILKSLRLFVEGI
jgi:hypothetical protein